MARHAQHLGAVGHVQAQRIKAGILDRVAQMRGVFIGICIIPFLVVVHQINIEYVAVFEPEYDAPVAADADAPVPFPIALQRVQAISGKVNVHRMKRRVEMGQHIGNALELIRRDLAGVSVLKQTLLGLDDGTSVSSAYCTVYRYRCQGNPNGSPPRCAAISVRPGAQFVSCDAVCIPASS